MHRSSFVDIGDRGITHPGNSSCGIEYLSREVSDVARCIATIRHGTVGQPYYIDRQKHEQTQLVV